MSPLLKSFAFTLFTILIVCSAYTMAWFYFAGLIERNVQQFVAEQSRNEVNFDGVFSPVYGFPGVFHLTYSGKIVSPSFQIDVPRLNLSGIPLPEWQVTGQVPEGIVMEGVDLPPHLKVIDYATVTFVVPKNIPADWRYPDIKVWQSEGRAHISVPALSVQWQDASIFASAELSLNSELQPEGQTTLGVVNHNFFVTILADDVGLPEKNKLLILTFLNALPQENGAVTLPFMLKENMLSLNGMPLKRVPPIIWSGTPYERRGNNMAPISLDLHQ